MQIGTLFSAPTQTAIRLAKTASFSRRRSPLKPAGDGADAGRGHDHDQERSHFSLRRHLDNLEKLLRAKPEAPSEEEHNNRRPSTLERLNLAGIWPGSKKVEEMSPRHLNSLQRLLSNSRDQSPSPRRPLDPDRWRDFHGRRDWAGLLDPLDDDLRREIIRYGEFVQGAYHTFHSDPATPAAAAPPPHRNVSVPDRSYRVTRNLYATAAVGLPAWVDAVAPELSWMTQRSSWAGFVAVCDDRREIERMGRRRDIVVVLRGTATCLEWAENARAHLVPISQAHQAQPKVECGFLSLYKTPGAHVQSLSESLVEELKRLIEQYKGEELSITITGHSLGAALAVLAADELSECIENVPPIAVISFGGPQVGNAAFADRVRENGVKVLRVVNSRDMVTKVPGLAYSHVGCELRLDSMASPVLKPDADPACCHDLEAYLHLVDGFTGPDCPFRDNAKRPIWRLLNEQGANVKKLYTSKAQHLSTSLAAQPIVNSGT